MPTNWWENLNVGGTGSGGNSAPPSEPGGTTSSNSSSGTTSPNPWGINTSTDSLLADYTIAPELRDTFADYDPSKEQFIQQAYRQQISGLQNSLLGMTDQFRGNTAGQNFNKAGMNNMYGSMQYEKLQQQSGLLGLNRNQGIYDVRQAHVTDTQNQIANLFDADADIDLTSETTWSQRGFESEDAYNRWYDSDSQVKKRCYDSCNKTVFPSICKLSC